MNEYKQGPQNSHGTVFSFYRSLAIITPIQVLFKRHLSESISY